MSWVNKFKYRKYRTYKNKHINSKRCFVIGNGPSLNSIDMAKLKDEVTFGSNRCFLGFKKWGYDFTYWVCQDELLFNQCQEEFWKELPESIPKFIPGQFKSELKRKPDNLFLFPMEYRPKNFPSFLLKGEIICEGWTVTYGMIQIAIYMGFKEIILVGVDHNYSISQEMIDDNGKWSDEKSSSHFDPSYCNSEKGQVWNLPQVDRMNAAYDCAASYAKANGIKIQNATPGTKLESFDKIEFSKLF